MVEAGSKARLCVVAVAFLARRVFSEMVCSGAASPGNGQRDKRHEQAELARISQAGVLDVEAAGLGIAEDALDRPPFAVGPQRGLRLDIGCHDQPFVLERFGCDGPSGDVCVRSAASYSGLVLARWLAALSM